MKTWYACAKCQKVDHYYVHDDGSTSFPRGEFLAHQDYLVTGVKTRERAEEWLTKLDPETGDVK